ncbi:glycosyltransferase [Jannaschia sp. 2305UL9-9]|uniref:glycosyltransferase n=1 Tax=Jannaschia sp. 2305UL9-9 TaxID=3121638 RepID=UPI0035296980
MMLVSHIAYLSIVVILGSAVSKDLLGSARDTVIAIGLLGTWRYSWALINFVRAAWFRVVSHPRRKARARARFAASGHKAHAYFLVTSYMIDTATTMAVYRSIFAAANKARDGATIVVSVVDGADERLVHQLYATSPAAQNGDVRLIVDRIPGTGKRDALARSFRIIARHYPTQHDVLLVADGDTCVPEDIIDQIAPVFSDPKVGALTTDEAVDIPDAGLFQDWFRLRFDQRQVMMCSMGLSRRVLTLTGRMSAFRACLATDPTFIEMVQADYIDHLRLGRVNFLTGDDKSTWFWLLRNGYQMIYLPDVQSISAETQPRDTFYASANVLMVRWFGNMLRTNGRALRLSPSRMGIFTWWSILDQRVSIWTTISGPILAVMAALFFDVALVAVYIAWIMLTRYVFVTLITAFRGRIGFPITYPFLLYFSQLYGALVKSFVLFRLDRQKWTRQTYASNAVQLSMTQRLIAASSVYMNVLTFGWLFVALFLLSAGI